MTPTLKTIDLDLLSLASVCSERNKSYQSLRESVDVVVTSPPYKQKDGYSELLMACLSILLRNALKEGGRAFVNFGQLKEDFLRPSTVQTSLSNSLSPGQTIAWIKSIAVDGRQMGHYQPINSKRILNYCWEPIFTFFKKPEPIFDRLALGVPYADKSNLARGTRGKNGDLHCAGDAWFVPYKTTGAKNKKRHAYEFPEEIVRRCLLLSGVKPGATVLDPFCGSGTTAVVAKSLGLNCIVIDCVEGNLKATQARWEQS